MDALEALGTLAMTIFHKARKSLVDQDAADDSGALSLGAHNA